VGAFVHLAALNRYLFTMNKLVPVLGCASILAIFACGEQISLNLRGCPCQPGWVCCEGTQVCVPPSPDASWNGSCGTTFCPLGIDLPRVPIVTESAGADASALPLEAGPGSETWSMNAYGTAYLDAGTQKFSYSESAWPLPGEAGNLGMGIKGWYVEAKHGQKFSFKLYARFTTDAGMTETVTLPLALYGPIDGVKTGNLCTAPSAVLAQQETVEWTADSDGFYLVAPYHPVVMMGSMPIIEGLGNTAYSNSYLEMSSSAE
jgi:hypothetical protein